MIVIRIKKTVHSLYNKKRDAQKAHSYDISMCESAPKMCESAQKKEPVTFFSMTSSNCDKNRDTLTHVSVLRNRGVA